MTRPRSIRLVLFAALLCACAPDAPDTRERTPEETAVLEAVDRFFATMTAKDSVGARAVLDPDGDFVSIRWNEEGRAVVRRASSRDYLNTLAEGPQSYLERVWDSEVRIHGPIAIVWTPYDFHIDGAFSHCGVDLFQLLKTDAGWVITGGTYTVERTGCPESPLGPPAAPPATERSATAPEPPPLPPVAVAAVDDNAADTAAGTSTAAIPLEAVGRDPALPDTVGVLLPRRLDDPDRETIENFYLYLPPGFGDDDREWPVLLYLHGRSLRGDDLALVKKYGIPSRIDRGHQLPFLVVAPQLPDGQRWVDMDRLWELLDEAVLDRYPVDDERIYVTGYSMGGGGAWRFAAAHADRLAAAIPISATTPAPTEDWAKRLEHLPLRVIHGDADTDAPYAPAVTMVDYLRARDVDVELVTIEGGTHNIVEQVYADPGLYAWLLRHER